MVAHSRGCFDKRQDVCRVSEGLPTDCLLVVSKAKQNLPSDYTVETLDPSESGDRNEHHLRGADGYQVPAHVFLWKRTERALWSAGFWPRTGHQKLVTRKYQTNEKFLILL